MSHPASNTDSSRNGMPPSRSINAAQVVQQGQAQQQKYSLVLNLWIHENASSKHEAWINYDLFPPGVCNPGDIVEVRAAAPKGTGQTTGDASSSAEAQAGGVESDHGGAGGLSEGAGKRGMAIKRDRSQTSATPIVDDKNDKNRFLFVVRTMDPEMRQKQPHMQISLAASIASIFNFQPRSSVVCTVVQKELHEASHIEISFRDQYIARSDMWRLATNILCDTCVYKGKKISFVGSIKAQVRSIYVRGQKVSSALFSSRTRPIFRSESARYAIFIQMSAEMWHFDTEGSGEIVFNKLINGFLPELFKRWRKINAHHLVNIVLFTRVVYEQGTAIGVLHESEELHAMAKAGTTYKDFFRVVVSNMASTDWTIILHQLKREFTVFLRDVLIQPVDPSPADTPQQAVEILSTHALPLTLDPSQEKKPEESERKPRQTHVIAGRPSPAIHGNVLEAINLATTQFGKDFVDRDLVRTGISIVIVTPGTGHFQVDYENLRMTTENLVSNGIGIDLVCLAKMPLHSVPLFKYKIPTVLSSQATGHGGGKGVADESFTSTQQSTGSYGSLPSRMGMSPPKASLHQPQPAEPGEWVYAIPHWIDISFWSSSMQTKSSSRHSKNMGHGARKRQFVARCKMYELQMMGIMENEISSISIPFLHDSPLYVPYSRVSGKSRIQQIAGPHAYQSTNAAAVREWEKKEEAAMFDWMDDYDDMVFRPLAEAREGIEKIKEKQKKEEQARQQELMNFVSGTMRPPLVLEKEKHGHGGSVAEKRAKEKRLSTGSRKETQLSPPALGPPPAPSSGSSALGALRPGRLARHISFGFRGFGGGSTPKAVASTGLSTTNAPGPILTRGFVPPEPVIPTPDKERPRTPVKSAAPSLHTVKDISTESSDSSLTTERNTPTSVKSASTSAPNAVTALERTQERRKPSYTTPIEGHKDRVQIDILKAASMSRLSGPRLDMMSSGGPVPASLSPSSALAPWFSLLNPCNPKKSGANLLNIYRRWQHVFPRPLRTASVKWKSLCSPAALPLTTEHFPTPEQLRAEYKENPYTISQNEDDEDLIRNREELVREMISQRLEQGFQIVVGSAVSDSIAGHINIFDKNYMTKAGSSVFMSMGNQIHQLICDAEYNVEVKRYVRKPTAATTASRTTKYTPYIRTILCDKYVPKTIDFGKGIQDYNWNYVDQFLGGYESNFTEQLRFCRSRFVLIPTDPPPSARRGHNPNYTGNCNSGFSEDSDEEIRLEGIKKLTQLFQRNRYIPPEDRNFEKASKKKDPNPLEILYKTFDPSVVVAQQLESLPLSADQMDASTRRSQLFVGTEMFERSNLNLKTLAQELQGPKGIRLQNRIWHLNFHQKCFIGSEFVTWMMENFRDLESRAEAVELANEFMKSGLFHHVENRHPLRDGNYFYQFSNDYAIARPSSKGGWFGARSRPVEKPAAVPPTPLANEATSPKDSRSRSSTVVMDDPENQQPLGLKRKIALSKAMKYDVDPGKKSYRPEIINLHYDRLHNPDNCYHIRIDWMNVTCKLIEDAISSWARTVDRYGLCLVEAPIDEISNIPQSNPFRAPSEIKPCIPPPQDHNSSFIGGGANIDMTASFSAALSKPDPLFYQKAILKKHNFVLDMEAAKNFPSDVEVIYSWGKPSYRYSQYIHRSGVVFAQITDDGTFLLMANRLYTQRAGPAQKYDRQALDNYESTRSYPGTYSIGVGYGNNRDGQGSISIATFPQPSYLSVPPPALAGGGGSYVTPEVVKDDLARFCQDEDELRKFYDDVDRRANVNVNVPSLNSSSVNSPQGTIGTSGGCMSLAQVATGPAPLPSRIPLRDWNSEQQILTPGMGSGVWADQRCAVGGGMPASMPPTPMLGPLGGTGGNVAATAASSIAANGRNSSRSGRSSIIEPVVELGERV